MSAKVKSVVVDNLSELKGRVERGRQLEAWIQSALEHREEFPIGVVRTVVRDYVAQWDALAPLLRDAGMAAVERRKQLAAQAGQLEEAAREIEAQIDELKLRKLIGEISADDFAGREKATRSGFDSASLAAIQEEMTGIDSVLADVGRVQSAVADLRRNAESLGAGLPPAPSIETTTAPAPAVAVPDPPPAAPTAEERMEDDELGEAAYASAGSGQEEWDVEPASGRDDSEPPKPPEPALSSAEDLMATGVIQARPDIGAAPILDVPRASEPAAPPATKAAPGNGPRVVVDPPEGDQVVYPFTGDVLSMGRGRNNDIQVKNDGKISRYHCRIFRRGDEYIIEDNKSSNGTLVNGKLVTRQRLDGGEEVQIGETRMTFYMQ
jgi:hypothetical protein